MNNKIDLNSIIAEVNKLPKFNGGVYTEAQYAKKCMEIAIHKTLLLASENAKMKAQKGGGIDDIFWVIDKQSILDIDKLIVD